MEGFKRKYNLMMYLLKFEQKKKLLSDVILLCNLNPTHYIYIYILIRLITRALQVQLNSFLFFILDLMK